MRREVVIIIDVDNQNLSIPTCEIIVTGIIQTNVQAPISVTAQWVIAGFPVHYISPIVLPTDDAPTTDTYNILHHVSGGSTWLEANEHCENLGGELHGVSSHDEKHTLFCNVHYIYKRQNFLFWKSQIIFLSKIIMVSVIINKQ